MTASPPPACTAWPSAPSPPPPAEGSEPSDEVVDLTTPAVDVDVDADADTAGRGRRRRRLVLPDPGGRAAPVSDRRQRALTAADLAPAADGVRPISAAARPRRRRSA